MYITLAEAKKHLNLDSGYTEDDAYIESLISTAENAVQQHVNRPLEEMAESGGTIPAPLLHAMLLMVGNLYQNREIAGYKNIMNNQRSYDYLIDLYRNYN